MILKVINTRVGFGSRTKMNLSPDEPGYQTVTQTHAIHYTYIVHIEGWIQVRKRWAQKEWNRKNICTFCVEHKRKYFNRQECMHGTSLCVELAYDAYPCSEVPSQLYLNNWSDISCTLGAGQHQTWVSYRLGSILDLPQCTPYLHTHTLQSLTFTAEDRNITSSKHVETSLKHINFQSGTKDL